MRRLMGCVSFARVHKGYISAQLLQKFAALSKSADLIILHLPTFEARCTVDFERLW